MLELKQAKLRIGLQIIQAVQLNLLHVRYIHKNTDVWLGVLRRIIEPLFLNETVTAETYRNPFNNELHDHILTILYFQ